MDPKELERILRRINRLQRNKENFVNSSISSFERQTLKLQSELFTLINDQFLGAVKVDKEGFILNNAFNLRLIGRIDRIFNRFNRLFADAHLKKFSADLLKVIPLTRRFYSGLGVTETILDRAQRKTDLIKARLGLSDKDEIEKGGFLDTLRVAGAPKQQIKDFILTNISTNTGRADFERGVKDLVEGNRRQNRPGALSSYYRTFAGDTFNQITELANATFAQAAGLRFFIYEGSLIDTSRPFCEKRAGRVFSVEEAENWKNDKDLIDKKTKDSYKPLIERGRYNCRHFIKYISDELAFFLRPELRNLEK